MLSEICEGMLASRVYWKFYFGFFPLVFHLFDVRIVLLEVWFLHHLYSSYSFTVSYCPKIHIWWRYENSNLNFSHWSLRPGILSWVRAEGNWWILFLCVRGGSVWISMSRKHIHPKQHIRFQIPPSYLLLQMWISFSSANLPLKRERMKLYICFLSTDCYVQTGVFFTLFLCVLKASLKLWHQSQRQVDMLASTVILKLWYPAQ